MSIVVSGLSFAYPNKPCILENISLSVPRGGKASLIGDNGCGKSTLLKLLGRQLAASAGDITIEEPFYMVPQQFRRYEGMTIASAIGVHSKLEALDAILAGSTDEQNYETLGDDWNIGERLGLELSRWGLGHLTPSTQLAVMSGGEKTRALIAGIAIADPRTVLMDEPTNHLDRVGRDKLYELIGQSPSTMLIVSHDRELLNLVDFTLELTPMGATRYGGGYDFYKTLRDEHRAALIDKIEEREKSVRHANRTAREAVERKNKSDARSKKQKQKEGVPRIMMGGLKDNAEKSSANLKESLSDKVDRIKQELEEMKGSLPDTSKIKLKFKESPLHAGKILIEGEGIGFGYTDERMLWPQQLDLLIRSGERVRIEGSNGSGKTTLLKIITGTIEPVTGVIKRSRFSYIYMDQEYSFIDDSMTVYGQLQKHNVRNLPEHELKTELHRFLFPADAWDNICGGLSGGEKMRLMLCCLQVSNDTPDVFILDEPTNNLDITSMEILTSVLRDFRGTLLLISHDNDFAREIGVGRVIAL